MHALYPATRNSFFFALFVFFRGYSIPDLCPQKNAKNKKEKSRSGVGACPFPDLCAFSRPFLFVISLRSIPRTAPHPALYPATRNSLFFALFAFFRGYSIPDFIATKERKEHKREILEHSLCVPFVRSLRLLRLFAAIPLRHSPISSRKRSSSSTVTPSCVASSSFDPAPGPATT